MTEESSDREIEDRSCAYLIDFRTFPSPEANSTQPPISVPVNGQGTPTTIPAESALTAASQVLSFEKRHWKKSTYRSKHQTEHDDDRSGKSHRQGI